MGNENSNPIRNMDKRTARREYRDQFKRAILDFQLSNGIQTAAVQGAEGREEVAETSNQKELKFSEDSKNNVRVLVRKRPIFRHEVDGSEFDVVSCMEGRVAVIHDTRMHADMRRMLITNNAFAFDGVFDERSSNEKVYQSACKPLVREAVLGGYATVCVYGQTGSGKSFTMTSFYEKAAHDIFAELDSLNDRMYDLPRISMSFFELQGEACLDLLNTFQPAQLLTAQDGGVHAVPVVEPIITSAEEMIGLITHALSIRSTSATGVHDASSRSHAILRIYVEQPVQVQVQVQEASGEVMMRRDLSQLTFMPITQPVRGEGVLTLVDLAGSEQSIDSMYHTAELRKEGAAINSSLMALKDCIRAKANGSTATHIYRKSKLTMALKDSFVLPTARTVIVATVSPSSKDTEHSLNTLRHACLMDGQAQQGEETRFMTGGTKSQTYQVGEVDVSSIARKNRDIKKSGGEVEPKTSNGNVLGHGMTKSGPMKKPPPELTDRQKAKARRIADRAGLNRMNSNLRDVLLMHRQTLGSEKQQIDRMRRQQNPYSAVDGRDSSVSPPPAPPGIPPEMPAGLGEMIYGQQAAAAHAAQHSDESDPNFSVTEYMGQVVDQDKDNCNALPRRPLSARVLAPTKSSNMRVAITSELRSSREIQRREQEIDAIQNDDEDEDPELEQYVLERMGLHDPNADAGDEEDDVNVDVYSNNAQVAPHRVEQRRPTQKPASLDETTDGRTPYHKLYVQIYGKMVEYHDQDSKAVLNRQLQTLMRMHGYAESEIHDLIASGRPTMPRRKPVAAAAAPVAEPGSTQPAPQRASHMSSYGGAAHPNGARSEVVHKAVQVNEQKAANLARQPPRERPNPKAGLQTASEKLAQETKLRDERRLRAKQVLLEREATVAEAARQKNREDLDQIKLLQMTQAAEEVDKAASVAAKRRENAIRIREQRELEHKQNALQRLNAKGFGSEVHDEYEYQSEHAVPHQHHEEQVESPPPQRNRSPPVPGRRRVVDTSTEDAEIARFTRLVVQARYQPLETQHRLKKQLNTLKINKTRKEKGEAPLEEPASGTPRLSPRPGSAGAHRPASVGASGSRISPRGTTSGSGYGQQGGGGGGGYSSMQRQSCSRGEGQGATAQGYLRNSPQQQNNQYLHSSYSHGAMPAQLRKEVHVGSNVMQAAPSPYGNGNINRFVGNNVNDSDNSHQELGKSGVEFGSLAHLQDYNHSNKKMNTPYSPGRKDPVTVHTQGRPQNSRGDYRVGASAAPFGNAMNSTP